MTSLRQALAAALIAAAATGATTVLAAGQIGAPNAGQAGGPPPGGQAGPGVHAGPDMQGVRGFDPRHQGGFVREGGPGRRHGMDQMGFLHGLQLSEAQRDKLFAILHAAAPQRHEQEKAVRHAREALRKAGEADRFDEAKAGAASRELGQALAAEALQRARLHAQVLAVLTPEQREDLNQRMRQHRPHAPQDRP